MTHRVLSDDEASNDSRASTKTIFFGFCKSWTLLKRREPFNNHVFGCLLLLLWMSYPQNIKTTRGWKLASFLTGTVIMSHHSSCCSLDCISVETFACIGLILKYQISQKEMKKKKSRSSYFQTHKFSLLLEKYFFKVSSVSNLSRPYYLKQEASISAWLVISVYFIFVFPLRISSAHAWYKNGRNCWQKCNNPIFGL